MNQHPPPSDMQQPLRFSSGDFASPDLALERFRKLTEDICNVILLGETKDFYVSSTTQHLSGALLLEARSSALRYDRTSRHVARGIDHFQLVMYLGGGAEFVSSDRTYRQRAGDVSVIDMGQPSLTREMQADDGATSVVSFVLPRLLLAPLLSAADSGPMIRIIPREAPYAGMLSEYMLSLRRCALELTHRESQAAVQSLAQLVAGGCNRCWEDDQSPASASQETLRARIETLHREQSRRGVARDRTSLPRVRAIAHRPLSPFRAAKSDELYSPKASAPRLRHADLARFPHMANPRHRIGVPVRFGCDLYSRVPSAVRPLPQRSAQALEAESSRRASRRRPLASAAGRRSIALGLTAHGRRADKERSLGESHSPCVSDKQRWFDAPAEAEAHYYGRLEEPAKWGNKTACGKPGVGSSRGFDHSTRTNFARPSSFVRLRLSTGFVANLLCWRAKPGTTN